MNNLVFSIYFFLRAVALLAVLVVFGFIFWKEDWIFSQIVVGGVAVLLFAELVFYIRKTERDVRTLLDVLTYNDYSRSLSVARNRSELLSSMERIKSEHAERHQNLVQKELLLEASLESVSVGIGVFSSNGNLAFSNQNFSKLLNSSTRASMNQLFEQYNGLKELIADIREGGELLMKPQEFDFTFSKDLLLKVNRHSTDKEVCLILVVSEYVEGGSGINLDAWINFGKVISHEINNGISPILSLSDSIKKIAERSLEEPESNKIGEACDIIIDQCQGLLNFNEKYRRLAKLPPMNFSRVDLCNLVQDVCKRYSTLLDSVELVFDFPDSAVFIKADSEQLAHVFSNLILNSIEAMKANDFHRIQISLSAKKENYLLSFSDNGVGIAKENRSKIFIPYFSTRENGSGIGLSLARQILWKHNAKIHLKEVEEGCEFVIVFPKIS